MPIFNLDYVNGSDYNSGDCPFGGGYTGAPLLSVADGVTNGTTTLTSATGGFDASMVGRTLMLWSGATFRAYRTISAFVNPNTVTMNALVAAFVGLTVKVGGSIRTISGARAEMIAPGDTVKIAKSPDPVSIGNATWTNGPIPATKNIVSSTNTTPIIITCNAHGFLTGDVVNITGHLVNTNANGAWVITFLTANTFSLDGSVGNGVGGATGTAQNYNANTVKLASALTQTIDRCETAWTPSANVTRSSSTTKMEGEYSESLAIAALFLGGLIAYKDIPAIDLTGYTQVTLWLRPNADINAGILSLLLDDTNGCGSPLENITINTKLRANKFTPITLTLSNPAALGAVVSVGLNALIDPGTVTILIDNIEACNGLSLQSLLSKNIAGEGWWCIRNIRDIIVTLGGSNRDGVADVPSNYYGTTETITTYRRETIKTAVDANESAVQDSGTSGNLITFSGGWNTLTNIQDGLSVFDGQCCVATLIGLNPNTKYYCSFSKLGFVRYYHNLSGIANSCEFDTIYIASPGYINWYSSLESCSLNNIYIMQGAGLGVNAGWAGCDATNIYICSHPYNAGTGYAAFYIYGSLIGTRITNLVSRGNGYTFKGSLINSEIVNLISSNNAATIDINNPGYIYTNVFFVNPVVTDTTFVTYNYPGGGFREIPKEFSRMVPIFRVNKYNGVAGDNRCYQRCGIILTNTAEARGGSGICLEMQPSLQNPTSGITGTKLAWFTVIPVVSGQAKTVYLWMKKSAAYNGNNPRLTLRFLGRDITGPTAIVETLNYVQYSITANAIDITEDGALELWIDCDGTLGSIYIDDITWDNATGIDTTTLNYWYNGLPVMPFKTASPGGYLTPNELIAAKWLPKF